MLSLMVGYSHQMRRLPNFNAERLLCIVADQGAGSRFLTGCLALSESVIIPDADLAAQRLSGKMNSSQLRDTLLQNCLAHDKKTWRDFGIVDKSFWGFPEIRYYDFSPKCAGLLTWGRFVVPATHDDDKWLICMVHNWNLALRVSQIWPKSTMLFVDNAQDFMLQYRPHYVYDGIFGGKLDPRINIFWRNCRGADWPLWPPRSKGEFDALPQWIQLEIASRFDNEILDYFHDPELERRQELTDQAKRRELLGRHPVLVWDAACFCQPSDFGVSIENLYRSLRLPDYDARLVMGFYHGWIQALEESLHYQQQWQQNHS